MSGPYELHLAHVRALGDAAVRLLEVDPLLNVRGAAAAVGVTESSVYSAWRRLHPDRPPRGRGRITPQMRKAAAEPFATLCDVMLDHVPVRGTAGPSEIFEAVRHDYGEVGERRLFRALRRLVEQGRIERVGEKYMSEYRRTSTMEATVDTDALKRIALAADQDEWQWQDDGDALEGKHNAQIVLYADDHEESDGPVVVASVADRAHIAAASPPVVLALIARIEELEDALRSACDLDDHGAMLTADADQFRALIAKGVVLT